MLREALPAIAADAPCAREARYLFAQCLTLALRALPRGLRPRRRQCCCCAAPDLPRRCTPSSAPFTASATRRSCSRFLGAQCQRSPKRPSFAVDAYAHPDPRNGQAEHLRACSGAGFLFFIRTRGRRRPFCRRRWHGRSCARGERAVSHALHDHLLTDAGLREPVAVSVAQLVKDAAGQSRLFGDALPQRRIGKGLAGRGCRTRARRRRPWAAASVRRPQRSTARR